MLFSSYWVLPLLFIGHDFEELVMVPTWLQHHDPRFGSRMLFGGVARADVLAVGIWEEFGLLVVISILAYWWALPVLVVAATIPYLVHLGLHVVFVFGKKSYVPGVVTAVIELPMTIAYVVSLSRGIQLAWLWWLLAIVGGFIVFGGNLALIHWAMPRLRLASRP